MLDTSQWFTSYSSVPPCVPPARPPTHAHDRTAPPSLQMEHQEQLRRFGAEMQKIRENFKDNVNMKELFNEDTAQLIHVLARMYSDTPNAMLMSTFF